MRRQLRNEEVDDVRLLRMVSNDMTAAFSRRLEAVLRHSHSLIISNETENDFNRENVSRIMSLNRRRQRFSRWRNAVRRHGSEGNDNGIGNTSTPSSVAQFEPVLNELREMQVQLEMCLEMQAELQRTMLQDVIRCEANDERQNDNDASRTNVSPALGLCIACTTKRVDTLLYKCGHCCLCFQCAKRLQITEKPCPICRADINDVVKVYSSSLCSPEPPQSESDCTSCYTSENTPH